MLRSTIHVVCLWLLLAPRAELSAEDWPMWGGDAGRQGTVRTQLPETLQLHWVRHLPAPRPAWQPQPDDGDKLQFDRSYAPVVLGDKLYLASMVTDRLTAYHVDSGDEAWRYYADGPLRLAPAAAEGRVYVVSDDGHLVCLDAETGQCLWRFCAAPAAQRVLGNERVISMWPARGGPVILDGIVYFGAGIWPMHGTFVYALRADTGQVVWANTGDGTNWLAQPHGGAYAFAGLAPQGYLAAAGDHLVVSGGRTPPALLDRQTGELVHINLQSKPHGGYQVSTDGEFYYNHGRKVHAIGWAKSAAVDRRGNAASAREFYPLPLGAGGEDRSVAGAIGGGLRLDGTAALVACDAPWAGQPNTFAAWLRVPQDLPDHQRIGIVAGNYPEAGSVNWEVQTGGRPRIHWNRGQVDWIVNVDVRSGQWLHYAFVRDAAQGRILFYLDGQLVATHDKAGDDVSPQTASYIGGDKRGPSSPWFSGALDDVRVYDRPLSAEEIAVLSRRGRAERTPLAGLVFHLPLDEQPATPGGRFSDASPSGNHGKLLAPSSLDAPHEVHGMIAVGDTLVLGGPDVVSALDLQAASPEHVVTWRAAVDGAASGLAWAAGRLYVSTDQGTIYCFGPDNGGQPRTVAPEIADRPWGDNQQYALATEEIIRLGAVRDGYALDMGCGEGRLAYELAQRTDLHVIGVESDPKAVAAARERLTAAGLYGTRVTVHQGDPARTIYPNYFADLVVSARSLSDGPDTVAKDEMMRLLRPWGGVAVVGRAQAMRRVERGELPGAGDWTHQYCNVGATLTSTDVLVRRPLGMLWFTDFEQLRMPDRHGRGPAPLFAGGRLFLLGMHGLYALNAYNGRLLWEHPIENVLKPYDQEHILGAAVTGAGYCYGQRSVYVRHENSALRIDEATGQAVARFSTPAPPGSPPGMWGFIATDDGVLFGSVANDEHVTMWGWREADMEGMPGESTSLFALDAMTGEPLWTYKASHSIRHNTIVIGDGRVYLIDRPLAQDDLLARQTRRADDPHRLTLAGDPAGHPYGVLVALDARSGEIVWTAKEDVFGTMLAHSSEHDVLVMTYQRNHAYFLRSEVGGRMAGYQASTGKRLWAVEADQRSRIMLNGDTIYAQAGAWNLLNGEPQQFRFARSYGCGTLAACRHMILFRSATLGYRDLATERTENYGGIRPGCWINAVPAGGLVLMPDATHGCTCSYLNKAYIALQPLE